MTKNICRIVLYAEATPMGRRKTHHAATTNSCAKSVCMIPATRTVAHTLPKTRARSRLLCKSSIRDRVEGSLWATLEVAMRKWPADTETGARHVLPQGCRNCIHRPQGCRNCIHRPRGCRNCIHRPRGCRNCMYMHCAGLLAVGGRCLRVPWLPCACAVRCLLCCLLAPALLLPHCGALLPAAARVCARGVCASRSRQGWGPAAPECSMAPGPFASACCPRQRHRCRRPPPRRPRWPRQVSRARGRVRGGPVRPHLRRRQPRYCELRLTHRHLCQQQPSSEMPSASKIRLRCSINHIQELYAK